MSKSITVKAPGRINIIGEHTDYNEGFVLPGAIDKAIIVQIHSNGTLQDCHVQAANLGETFHFNLQELKAVEPGWANYVLGVVHELQQLGGSLSGFDAVFEGDVPIGSGMSSSAALECSFAFALNELFELGLDRWTLIKAAQRAEHKFVGTKCGIMDQFSSVMGKKDQVMLLDCRSLDFEYLPCVLGDYQLILLNTNVSHSLASSEYNTRREECESGVAILQEQFPAIQSLRDVTMEMFEQGIPRLPLKVAQRCKHVISENERVLEATRALQSRDFKRLGELMYASHRSLQHDYEVSCPELDFLVEQTRFKDYVLGARMMGGGFGGCTINLIEKQKVAIFQEAMAAAYQRQFGIDLTPYEVSIENGAQIL
jgi:galactokinase